MGGGARGAGGVETEGGGLVEVLAMRSSTPPLPSSFTTLLDLPLLRDDIPDHPLDQLPILPCPLVLQRATKVPKGTFEARPPPTFPSSSSSPSFFGRYLEEFWMDLDKPFGDCEEELGQNRIDALKKWWDRTYDMAAVLR